MFCIPSGGVNPSFGTLRVCCCGRKKLPFAGYSIVKELLFSGGKIPRSPELAILRLWVGRLQGQFGGTIGEGGRRAPAERRMPEAFAN